MGKRWAIDQMYEHEGEQYGSLTVVYTIMATESSYARHLRAFCRCTCGNYKFVMLSSIKKGDTVSCGCKKSEDAIKMYTGNHFRQKHGKHGTRTYRIWKGMRTRVNNPHMGNYSFYGGRGITICPRWDDYALFLQDMGNCPEGCSIDRIDPNGNYEPGNCRWATWGEQCWNKRTTIKLEYQGKTWNLLELSNKYNINSRIIYNRIFTYHWNLDRALSTPVRQSNRKGNENGK